MTTRKKSLRAVTDGEKAPAPAPAPAPAKRKTVTQAAESGSHRDLLVAMRERIAKAVESPDCPPRDLAALTRRLQDIAKEIEAIDLRAREEELEDVNADESEAWEDEAL